MPDSFYCVAVGTSTTSRPPVPLPGVAAGDIPETRRYRLKNKLLGPPLVTEQLASERLNKPTALGVLSPDCISSSAYGTEEMLTQLVPYVGLAAFTLVVPITLAILLGFPYLASFVAGDRFLPRQLTRRGHRLAFSNGILVLAGVALALVLAYKAQVNGLVALYAIGVFTGFTMAGSGMVKHHLTAREGHWRRSVAINGFSAFLSFTVVLIFSVAKFKEGAWLIFVVGPLLYIGLIRLHHQYVREAKMLETGVVEASEAPVLRRHVVVVLVDRLDMATARALQYARTLVSRRPAGGALRHRHQGGPRARVRVEPVGAGPAPPRHHRVPGPATGPGRH